MKLFYRIKNCLYIKIGSYGPLILVFKNLVFFFSPLRFICLNEIICFLELRINFAVYILWCCLTCPPVPHISCGLLSRGFITFRVHWAGVVLKYASIRMHTEVWFFSLYVSAIHDLLKGLQIGDISTFIFASFFLAGIFQ